MHLHSWWYISSSETSRLLYYKQDCKMCITAIKSNLYQMMSFLPQVHWYVFLKLNHRGKNLVTMKTVKLWADTNVVVAFKPQLHTFDQLHGTCGSYFCILLVLRIPMEMAKWIWRLPQSYNYTHVTLRLVVLNLFWLLGEYWWHMANARRYECHLCQSHNYTSDHGTCGLQLILNPMFCEHLTNVIDTS